VQGESLHRDDQYTGFLLAILRSDRFSVSSLSVESDTQASSLKVNGVGRGLTGLSINAGKIAQEIAIERIMFFCGEMLVGTAS
jgi:hypothetical protein